MSLRIVAVLSVSGVVMMTGCKETTSSENIRTRGIAMTTEVTAHSASHSLVRTRLRVGGDESNTYVILEGGDRLVLVVDGDNLVSDAAQLANVSVSGQVVEHTKGPKIRIHKFKNKTGYHKRQGHRQPLTRVKVTGISTGK